MKDHIYIHFLFCGRDDAVKQFLDQYDIAQSFYCSAGLLAKNVLMEPKICVEDYVQGVSKN